MAAKVEIDQSRTESAAQRNKGPIVWLDMDQKELDDAYDQTVYAPNQPLIAARRKIASESVLRRLGLPQRVAYGRTEVEKLDIYKTRRQNAPVCFAKVAQRHERALGIDHYAGKSATGTPLSMAAHFASSAADF